MDTLTQIVALISAAIPISAFIPQVRRFLFGETIDGQRKPPTLVAQVTLILLGGAFCSLLSVLFVWFNITNFVTVELGPEQIVSGLDGAFVVGNVGYCKNGKVIGVSCRVISGGGNIQNQSINGDVAECSWHEVSNNFHASVRAICLRGGPK